MARCASRFCCSRTASGRTRCPSAGRRSRRRRRPCARRRRPPLTYLPVNGALPTFVGRRRGSPGDRVVAEDRDLRPGRLEDRRLAGRRQVLAGARSTLMPQLREVLDRLEHAGRRRRRGCGCWPARRSRCRRPRARRRAPDRRRRPSRSCASGSCSGAGFSKLAIAMSAPLIRSRIAPALPVRLVYGMSQPNGEQSLQRPVISAVPPSNGKSAPLPLTLSVS